MAKKETGLGENLAPANIICVGKELFEILD
jgi:hypothetical protein